jgi:exonuclease III
MQIHSDEVLRGLINIFNINGYRVEVYQKLKQQIFNPELQHYFQKQVDESSIIIKELNPILKSCMKESQNPAAFEDVRLDQSQFYFGMACASRNPRTVMVSCQFGNEFLMKAYQQILNFLDTNALDSLWKLVSKHLESIRNSYMDFEHSIINEVAVRA